MREGKRDSRKGKRGIFLRGMKNDQKRKCTMRISGKKNRPRPNRLINRLRGPWEKTKYNFVPKKPTEKVTKRKRNLF